MNKSIYQLPIDRILFLDVESVSIYKSFSDQNPRLQELWEKKMKSKMEADKTLSLEDTYPEAGIFPEFGKIICISVGHIHFEGNEKKLRLKSFYGDDEKKLLQAFFELLESHFNTPESYLCAHNGKEFDFPYICKRAIINGLPLPNILDVGGKKPWETTFFDTMEYWKFGAWKNNTSLNLLTAIFDVPTPKDDIDGSQIYSVYWEENDLERIMVYCEKDVKALVEVFLRMRGEKGIE